MLTNLYWDTLKQRLTQAKLTALYKIINNILHIPADSILTQSIPPYPIRSHHTHNFNVPLLATHLLSSYGMLYHQILHYNLTLKQTRAALYNRYS